jgi:hypothetical protein
MRALDWLAELRRYRGALGPCIGYHARSNPYSFWEDRNGRGSLHIALRKFLKVVGITSQREIERVVREGKVEGTELKLRMTLTAENAPLDHIVKETIDLR